jgi:hypothetical protein
MCRAGAAEPKLLPYAAAARCGSARGERRIQARGRRSRAPSTGAATEMLASPAGPPLLHAVDPARGGRIQPQGSRNRHPAAVVVDADVGRRAALPPRMRRHREGGPAAAVLGARAGSRRPLRRWQGGEDGGGGALAGSRSRRPSRPRPGRLERARESN